MFTVFPPRCYIIINQRIRGGPIIIIIDKFLTISKRVMFGTLSSAVCAKKELIFLCVVEMHVEAKHVLGVSIKLRSQRQYKPQRRPPNRVQPATRRVVHGCTQGALIPVPRCTHSCQRCRLHDVRRAEGHVPRFL